MAAIELVVTDLDGTLWHTDDAVHQRVADAIRELEERGVPLLVATGRRLASTRAPLAAIGLAPAAVVLNGALGVDLATGERFHRAPFPTAQAEAALGAFRSVGLDPVVYVDHPRYDAFLSPTPSTHPSHVAALGDTAGVDDLQRVAREEAVLGFGMIGVPHGDGVASEGALGGLAEVHLDRSLDYPGQASLTVAPRGQSKWDGVLAFCAAQGLRSDRVLAVADGPNDLELLANATVAAVPRVAHPAALDRADHVIPAAADGGWADILTLLE
ncbi:MAG: HAD family hydrolase [Acidimicrobiales bacterium]|nr:HAD family hydrolase [Acidimicrobiales bacterium]